MLHKKILKINLSYLKKKNFNLNIIRKMSLIPKKKFNNGYEIPVLGLGTYKVKFFILNFII